MIIRKLPLIAYAHGYSQACFIQLKLKPKQVKPMLKILVVAFIRLLSICFILFRKLINTVESFINQLNVKDIV